jgi:hypothetical protein
MIIVSYTKEEYPNSADVDPLALYLGSKDAALGGPQQRIRMDVGLGLGRYFFLLVKFLLL